VNKENPRDELKQWKARFVKEFEPVAASLIPALEAVQKEAGYLPRAAMTALARHLKLPEAKVFGVASFYSLFHLAPRGRHQITVCRGTACHVRGSGRLLAELEARLGIEAGESTPDMQISLETVACLGSCALAPVVVKDKIHGRQNSTSVKKIVDEILSPGKTAAPAGKKTTPKPTRQGRK
jgi:NADH-quinone oxidoreductase subunit E